MTAPLLIVRNLVKRFGGLTATDDLSFEVAPGELHALIGPNGAGKTTVVSQLIGELTPDGGTISFDGYILNAMPTHERVRLGLNRTFQIVQLLPDFTALENVALAVQAHQGHSFQFWADARRDNTLTDPAHALLEQLGLAARAGEAVANLSHGERKQLELAVALASRPKMLLLDEPMAGLGASESRVMTDVLQSLKGRITMLLVEHDMDAVFALADRISVLVYGRRIAVGSVEDIRASAEVKAAYLGGEEA